MKLPHKELTLELKIAEFDFWITPSTHEISDTEKFKSELKRVSNLFLRLGEETDSFTKIESCSPSAISAICVSLIKSLSEKSDLDKEKYIKAATETLESLFSLLFIVTGKSDNNLKCQFPVYLFLNGKRTSYPVIRKRAGKFYSQDTELSRTIESKKIAKRVAECIVYADLFRTTFSTLESDGVLLLSNYLDAVLDNVESKSQLMVFGRLYLMLRREGNDEERSLLSPLVAFKVKGSVAASGGHIPENTLRDNMESWGLEPSVDYNMDDVDVGLDNHDESKTRAYDFVIPYRSGKISGGIFIQSQFYAGDSGSVSHKVVDQTRASRPLTQKKYPSAIFVELLDGAGYYSSLNVDLKHMIGMKTTAEFIQLRSANIKLRREFQKIGYLTLLEIEHAIFRSEHGQLNEIVEILQRENYAKKEIDRCLERSIERNLIVRKDNKISVAEERKCYARRYFIIDMIALIGEELEIAECNAKILIPGYGPYFGISMSALSGRISSEAINLSYSRDEFANDITWLSEKKYTVLR